MDERFINGLNLNPALNDRPEQRQEKGSEKRTVISEIKMFSKRKTLKSL